MRRLRQDADGAYGGKATCKKAAVCEICGEEYGDLNPNNHSGKTGGWQKDNGKHWKVYDCCPAARAEEGDHNSVKDAAKAPACMDTGLTEGAHCGTCGEVLTKQETVKALGHDWGPWTVTTSPTVTAEGVETRTCRNDASHTETRSIPKLTPAPRPDPTPGKTDGKKTDGSKTDSDKTVQSGRTGDIGIGLYAATVLLSLTGMAWVSKKRKKCPFHNGGIVCRREKEKETLRRLFFCDFYEFIPPQRRACGC